MNLTVQTESFKKCANIATSNSSGLAGQNL